MTKDLPLIGDLNLTEADAICKWASAVVWEVEPDFFVSSPMPGTRRFRHVLHLSASDVKFRYGGWVKTHLQFEVVCGPNVVLRRCRRPLVVCKHLAACVYHVSFRRYRPLKLPLSCEIVKKVVFGPTICMGKEKARFRACILKLHLLPTMWPDMVEFHLASSEIRGREKERRKKKRKNPW